MSQAPKAHDCGALGREPRVDDDEASLSIRDRPTMPAPPVPHESGLRLRAGSPSSFASAVVDVVVCDLSRDPRSESFRLHVVRDPLQSACKSMPVGNDRNGSPQNERPPSTSTVRALK
jgi:hypothetical protein